MTEPLIVEVVPDPDVVLVEVVGGPEIIEAEVGDVWPPLPPAADTFDTDINLIYQVAKL